MMGTQMNTKSMIVHLVLIGVCSAIAFSSVRSCQAFRRRCIETGGMAVGDECIRCGTKQ